MTPAPAPAGDAVQRVFANSAVMVGCRVVAIIASLLIVPAIVAKVGFAGYGTWESLFAASMVGALLQQAILSTVLWRVATAFGAGDMAEVRRVPRLGLFVVLVQSAVVLPAVLLCRHSIVQAFNVPAPMVSSAERVLPWIMVLVLIGGVGDVFGAVVSGCQRSGRATIVQTGAQLANYLVAFAFLSFGFGLESLLAGLAVAQGINLLLLHASASAACGSIPLLPVIPTRRELSQMSSYFGLVVVGSISVVLRDQLDKIVLATFGSPELAGYYGIAARLAAVIMLANNFFYVPIISAAGALKASGDWELVRGLYSKMSIVVPFAVGAIVVLIGGLHEGLVWLWMGRAIPEVGPIVILLVVGNSCAVMFTSVGTAICKGIGRVGIETRYVVVNLFMNLLGTILLVGLIGPIGTVISSVVSWACSALFFVYLLHHYLDLPLAATRRAITIALVAFGVAAAFHFGYARFGDHAAEPRSLGSLAKLAAWGTAALAVYVVLTRALSLVPSWRTVRARA